MAPSAPHCGHQHDISECDWYDLYEEGEHEKECERCEREFSVSTRVSYTFHTDDQLEPDESTAPTGEAK